MLCLHSVLFHNFIRFKSFIRFKLNAVRFKSSLLVLVQIVIVAVPTFQPKMKSSTLIVIALSMVVGLAFADFDSYSSYGTGYGTGYGSSFGSGLGYSYGSFAPAYGYGGYGMANNNCKSLLCYTLYISLISSQLSKGSSIPEVLHRTIRY